MLNFTADAMEPLRALRRILDQHGYDFLLRGVRGVFYFFEPWLGDEAFRFFHEATPLPPSTKHLYSLFLLGRTVPKEELKATIPPSLLEDLLGLGLLLEHEAQILTDQYAILSQNGMYFITTYISQNNPKRAFNVYMGRDSFKLLHSLDRSRRGIRALDLCGGSGILGQSLVPWAKQVVAVELCEEAIHVSRANAVLNGIEDIWEVRQGDLWQPVAQETFDLVVSNPPFVATPIDIDIPIYGWGGKDGLLFLERILADLPRALASEGRAQLVFECIGSAQQAAVVPLLEAFIKDHPTWASKLLLYDRVLLTHQTCRLFGEAAGHLAGNPTPEWIDDITRKVVEAFQAQNMRYMYRALLTIESQPLGEPGATYYDVFNPWDNDSVPTPLCATFFQPVPQFSLQAIHGVSLEMNSIERDICSHFNGTNTIEQAAQAAWEGRGGPNSGVLLEPFIARALELCRIMQQIGFIAPPAHSHWAPYARSHNPFVTRPEDSEFFKALQRLPHMAQVSK